MDAVARIEQSLEAALRRAVSCESPPLLGGAMQHAVLPGGGRIRPRLCLAVARACAEDHPRLSDAAACAIELLHCASLVHDDLPCFDDAELRRGRPSVHTAFGEPLAVLAGDALIVLAFQTLASGATSMPSRLPGLLEVLASAVGMPAGIVAGQAMESEPRLSLGCYQQAKTGALFRAATTMGALAAGAPPDRWGALGEHLGAAYQVADDIKDVVASEIETGKPSMQDERLDRPSSARSLGVKAAVSLLETLLERALSSVPDCPDAEWLRQQVALESARILPARIMRLAA
ncbi:MAG: polyprenyl synthetase family protein [Gammaproteobacteria bacterium]|nr:polyprenyl synthetase family protein [Gammaproteobacteria bacterium]